MEEVKQFLTQQIEYATANNLPIDDLDMRLRSILIYESLKNEWAVRTVLKQQFIDWNALDEQLAPRKEQMENA